MKIQTGTLPKIEIDAVFGYKRRRVEISQPHGNGQFGLQLVINKRYCGTLVKRRGEWDAHLNERSLPEFTSTDVIPVSYQTRELYNLLV